MNAVCPDCGWTMPADDDEEAWVLLEVHRIVKLEQAITDDQQGAEQ